MRVRWYIGIAAVALTAALGNSAEEKGKKYESPYSVKFKTPVKELLADFESGERANPKDESTVPFDEWYSRKTRDRFEGWGPPSRHYPAPADLNDKSVEWKRERTVAVALRFIGYGYQHHHVPDWDPPADWPWKETGVGHNGKGVDCSNFTAFVYNQGFGLKPTGNVHEQSKLKEFPGPGEGRMTKVQHIPMPDTYAEICKVLRTGDLVYVRSTKGEISHVILWVGSIGQSPEDTPLVIDSHGEGVKDSNGVHIPVGIHLRPFREHSWYHKSADHAIRVWQDE